MPDIMVQVVCMNMYYIYSVNCRLWCYKPRVDVVVLNCLAAVHYYSDYWSTKYWSNECDLFSVFVAIVQELLKPLRCVQLYKLIYQELCHLQSSSTTRSFAILLLHVDFSWIIMGN